MKYSFQGKFNLGFKNQIKYEKKKCMINESWVHDFHNSYSL